MLERIEPQYFELSEYILQEAKKRLNISLNLSLIIPFTDHLVAAIDRAKSGISLPNLSLMEIKTIWKKEFEFSLWIISYIEEKMHINMSIDEAGYIAVYFVNDTGEPRANKSMEIVQIVTDIVNIIEKCFRIRLDKTSSSYIRLVTHLRFFIGRIIGSEVSRDDDNEVLYQYLLERNPNLKTCINYISQYIKNELNYDVTKSELVYLMIHLTQILGK
ncbi:PRD domain-containing protein [Clostridioides sp. ES-S-0056-01]|uniref:PRD domain-containing protein n=1 Tax=Clostridioides sp. ES-S-0056-01 TaxID=2770781 RepID=UPI001D128A93